MPNCHVTCSVPADELPADLLPDDTDTTDAPVATEPTGFIADPLEPKPAEPKPAEPKPAEPKPAEPAPIQLALASAVEVDEAKRTISGLILPYDVLAQRTSYGPVRFTAGSLRHHPEVKRIKLLVDHDRSKSVGHATSITTTPDGAGVVATFKVPAGPEGDDVLTKAANGVRDGLSVGADITMSHKSADGRVTNVTEATLNEVSIVSLPAFDDARVFTVRASATPPAEPVTPPASNLEPAPYVQAGSASAAGVLDRAINTVQTALAAGGGAAAVNAALADVVPANDAGAGFLRPSYGTELWTARNTATPFLDALADSVPLTGPVVHAWRWKTRPQVGPYTGNKTEIPTNAVATEPAQFAVERHAGGWDVDRIYTDLGDGSMVQAMFDGATEDYAQKLEAAIAAKLRELGSVVEASTSVPAALAKLGVVAAQLGASLSLIGMAPDVWAEFTNLKPAEVPWWLQRQGDIDLGGTTGSAGGLRFGVNYGLTSGEMIAADRRAVKVRRPAGDPVRVQALDVAHGGIDLAVYGYHATIVHDARAVLRTTVTAG